MSRHFSQGKLNGQDYEQAITEVQKCLQEAALGAITPVLEAFLEAKSPPNWGERRESCDE